MTSRERWTVYPLLFLSLGIGLRNRVAGIETSSVQCESLTIANSAGKPVARLHAVAPNRGQLEFCDPDGKILLAAGTSADAKTGVVQILTPSRGDGVAALVAAANDSGGFLQSWNADHSILLHLGFDGKNPVLFAANPKTNIRSLWLPARIQVPNPPKPAETEKTSSDSKDSHPTSEKTLDVKEVDKE